MSTFEERAHSRINRAFAWGLMIGVPIGFGLCALLVILIFHFTS